MPNIPHLYSHFKKHGLRHQSLYMLGIMIFFFEIFDGAITYMTPLILTEKGYSDTMMGIIIGSSSIFGAFFDLIFCWIFKNITFRRIFLLMFLLCSFYPLILWEAKALWIFVVAMAVWGIYYDLYNYGIFDFVGRYTKEEEHSSSFGVTQAFRSLGCIVAPLMASLTIVSVVVFNSIVLAWIFLAISLFFFGLIIIQNRNKKAIYSEKKESCAVSTSSRITVMLKISRIIFPVLIMTMMAYIVESFFWTLGPVYAEDLGMGKWSGLLIMAYSIPAVLLGWYVGEITNRWGKKRTAYGTFFLGSFFLVPFMMIGDSAVATVASTFIAACFFGLSLPAINSSYADYISEHPHLEGEIEAAEDFFTNLAYIFGPMLCGAMADAFNYKNSFGLLGVFGIFISVILLKFSPKKIRIAID